MNGSFENFFNNIMTLQDDDSKNIRLYESLLSQHGDSFKSLNWGSRESQIRRFEVLAEVGIKSGDSVLDVGCGLADLYGWLRSNEQDVLYTGIDITPGMVKKAKQKYTGIELIAGNIFDVSFNRSSYDYVVASGVFTYIESSSHFLINRFIARMFDMSNKAIAFNALSSWASIKDADEFYVDPLQTLDFCRNLTPWVTLRHDYHPRDFTIYMYKNRSL